MDVGVVIAFCLVVFLAGQPHEPVVVEENGHGADDRSYENVDPEIVLVTHVEGGLLNIFLYDVLVLGFLNLPSQDFLLLLLGHQV